MQDFYFYIYCLCCRTGAGSFGAADQWGVLSDPTGPLLPTSASYYSQRSEGRKHSAHNGGTGQTWYICCSYETKNLTWLTELCHMDKMTWHVGLAGGHFYINKITLIFIFTQYIWFKTWIHAFLCMGLSFCAYQSAYVKFLLTYLLLVFCTENVSHNSFSWINESLHMSSCVLPDICVLCHAADFGVSAKNENTLQKRSTFIGTPYW